MTATLELIQTTETTNQGEAIGEETGFRIDSDRAAEWLLRRLGNIEAEKARVTAQAARIVKQLDNDAESLRHLYQGELEAYCRAKLAAGGNRRRSVHFLQGSCSFRTVPGGLRISDQQTAHIYAKKAFPAAIKRVETLDIGAYRTEALRRYQENGERLPGTEIEPEKENFRLSFGAKE